MRNVHFEGTVEALFGSAGGLVGETNSSIFGCSVEGSVTNLGGAAAGVAGTLAFSPFNVRFCAVNADITGTDLVAGISSRSAAFFTDNVFTGTVTGDNQVGGLVGTLANSHIGNFQRNLFLGDIFGAGSERGRLFGGLTGGGDGSALPPTSYSLNSSECENCDQSLSGQPLSSVELTQRSSFSGWDFVNVWRLRPGDSHPSLRKQAPGP